MSTRYYRHQSPIITVSLGNYSRSRECLKALHTDEYKKETHFMTANLTKCSND